MSVDNQGSSSLQDSLRLRPGVATFNLLRLSSHQKQDDQCARRVLVPKVVKNWYKMAD